MVTVINYEVKKNEKNEPFFTLVLQGGIELVQSKTSKQYYATVRRTSMLTTFDEPTCIAMIGEKIPGHIAKVKCKAYEYTNTETGEVVKMNYRWEYQPEEPAPVTAFPNNAIGKLAKVVH